MLRASIAYRDGALTLIAVESAESYARREQAHWQVGGIVKPIAVVVCGPGGAYALDMEAKPVDLETLRQEVPALDAAISSGNRTA